MSTSTTKQLDSAIKATDGDRKALLSQAMTTFNSAAVLQQSLREAQAAATIAIAQRAVALWRTVCESRSRRFDEPLDWMVGVGLVRYSQQTQYIEGTLLAADVAATLTYANVLLSFQLHRRDDGWMVIHSIQPCAFKGVS